MNNNKATNKKNGTDNKQTTRVFARLISSRAELDKIAGGQKCTITDPANKSQIDCIYE